ncbi:MAG: hypothetical protein GY724_14790 [Actinomycetia bacterium]|nr:hypothetical protein [Actinomycetes bacterium]MCP5030743.1 hypothetical protein [Actinomycetes bacterium]
MARSAKLRELQDRLAPVTLAREQLLAVPEPLQPLFPFGGLQKGQSVGFRGPGNWSLAMAMAGSLLGNDGWMAIVGVEELGLLSAAEVGVRLDRLLLIETPPSAQLATVVAALVEVMGVVALSPHREVGHRDARRLTARAREQGSTLLLLDGGRHWPQALDLTITTKPERWEGVGQGHGHLQWRQLSVEAVGRRSSARRRQVSVLLPGPGGSLAFVDPVPAPRPEPALVEPLARVS